MREYSCYFLIEHGRSLFPADISAENLEAAKRHCFGILEEGHHHCRCRHARSKVAPGSGLGLAAVTRKQEMSCAYHEMGVPRVRLLQREMTRELLVDPKGRWIPPTVRDASEDVATPAAEFDLAAAQIVIQLKLRACSSESRRSLEGCRLSARWQ